MTSPLPKWIQTRYAALWKKYGEKEITFEQIEQTLKNKKGINVFISDLRKAGWAEVKLDEKDTRKRKYKLKNPEDIFGEING